MEEDRNNEPTQRFKTILSAEKDDENVPPNSLPRTQSQSPLEKLPRLKPSTPPPAQPATQTIALQSSQTPPPTPQPASPFKNLRFGPPFWTVTGILSLAVNGVLIAVLLILLRMLGTLQLTAGDVGAGLVGGLYSNFEKMDRSHIRTEIPINTEIPVQFDLQISTQTDVTLSQDVTINGALVTLQTGGLEIVRAPTNIVLPAGTVLPINLSLTVPVDKRVPVNLIVPVDIALNQTDLHDPFVGLQEVIRPLYCLVEPNASNLDGQLVCR